MSPPEKTLSEGPKHIIVPYLTPEIVDIVDAARVQSLRPYAQTLPNGQITVDSVALREYKHNQLINLAPLNAQKLQQYAFPVDSLEFQAYQHAIAPVRAARFQFLQDSAQTRVPEEINWGDYYYDPRYQKASRQFIDKIAVLAHHIAFAHLSRRIGFSLSGELMQYLERTLHGTAEQFDTPVSPDPMEQELFIDGTGGGLTYSAYVIFSVLSSLHQSVIWERKSFVPRPLVKKLRARKDDLFGDYLALNTIVFTY